MYLIHIYIFYFIYLFIYLLSEDLLPPLWGRPASMPRKETRRKEKEKDWRKGKGTKRIGWNPKPRPGQLMRSCGRKKRTENRRKKNRQKHGAGPKPSYPGPFVRFLRPASFIREACSDPIPRPQGGIYYYY